MKIEISEQLLSKNREEILFELAVILYTQAKISLGKASKIAGIPYVDFQFKLAELGIPINSSEDLLQQDFNN